MANQLRDGAITLTPYYCESIVSDPDEVIGRAKDELDGVDFDTFVVRGMSGALIAPLLAREMGKKWLLVRKPEDAQSSHSSTMWIGELGRRWIFLDDFVSSGNTRRKVFDGVAAAIQHYNNGVDYSWKTGENVGTPREPYATEYVGTYSYERREFEVGIDGGPGDDSGCTCTTCTGGPGRWSDSLREAIETMTGRTFPPRPAPEPDLVVDWPAPAPGYFAPVDITDNDVSMRIARQVATYGVRSAALPTGRRAIINIDVTDNAAQDLILDSLGSVRIQDEVTVQPDSLKITSLADFHGGLKLAAGTVTAAIQNEGLVSIQTDTV